MTEATTPPDPDDPAVIHATVARRVGWIALVVLLAGCIALLLRGADQPADPYLLGSPDAPELLVRPQGFASTAIEVTTADGRTAQWCVLVAETDAQRARGLMTVTDPDLGGYDALLFRFEREATGGFWMRNTPMALSIAYIAEDGSLVSVADMTPCADVDDCPTYAPRGPYRWAVEVPRGGLEGLGLVDGSRFTDQRTSCTPA